MACQFHHQQRLRFPARPLLILPEHQLQSFSRSKNHRHRHSHTGLGLSLGCLRWQAVQK